MADRFASQGYSLKKQTRWWNDKTIIELGYRKISWFVSASQITSDKSQYFAQPPPKIVKYRQFLDITVLPRSDDANVIYSCHELLQKLVL